MVEFQAIDKSV